MHPRRRDYPPQGATHSAPHLSQGSSFPGPQPLVPKRGDGVAACPGGCREISGGHPQSPDSPLCRGATAVVAISQTGKQPGILPSILYPAPQPPALGLPGGSTKHELNRIICSSSKETGSGRDHLLGSPSVFSYLVVERCLPLLPRTESRREAQVRRCFYKYSPPHFMLCNSAPKVQKPTDPRCLLSCDQRGN